LAQSLWYENRTIKTYEDLEKLTVKEW
jgi:hypothetical protein